MSGGVYWIIVQHRHPWLYANMSRASQTPVLHSCIYCPYTCIFPQLCQSRRSISYNIDYTTTPSISDRRDWISRYCFVQSPFNPHLQTEKKYRAICTCIDLTISLVIKCLRVAEIKDHFAVADILSFVFAFLILAYYFLSSAVDVFSFEPVNVQLYNTVIHIQRRMFTNSLHDECLYISYWYPRSHTGIFNNIVQRWLEKTTCLGSLILSAYVLDGYSRNSTQYTTGISQGGFFGTNYLDVSYQILIDR